MLGKRAEKVTEVAHTRSGRSYRMADLNLNSSDSEQSEISVIEQNSEINDGPNVTINEELKNKSILKSNKDFDVINGVAFLNDNKQGIKDEVDHASTSASKPTWQTTKFIPKRSSRHFPKFWKNSPAEYLIFMDSLFLQSDITSETEKYQILVNCLDQVELVRLKFFLIEIKSSPSPYKFLREAIIDTFVTDKTCWIGNLNKIALGNEKPSEIIFKMCTLCPTDPAMDKTAKQIIVNHLIHILPANIATIIQTKGHKSLREIWLIDF